MRRQSHRRRYWWAAASLVLILALLAVSTPSRAEDQPWNLALVLDLTAPMGGQWLGTTRAAALADALAMELRTLPLRVTAGLWAALGDRTFRLMSPRGATKFKGLRLKLPKPAGRQGVVKALESAADWLQSTGGGSILLLTGPSGLAGPEALFDRLPQTRAYLHVFALAPGAAGPSLQKTAAQGGGLFIAAGRPADTARLLRRAVSAALSQAFLEILAFDEGNKPLHLPFTLQRRDQAWGLVSGRAHRRLQLPAGAYSLSWPQGPPPAATGARRPVVVERQGLSKLWLGGRAKLSVQAKDAKGKPLAWKVKVSNADTGDLVTPFKPAPLDLSMPSGRYLVRTLAPAHQWQVELAAGQKIKMTVGPPGSLQVKLSGPLGPVRIPYEIVDLRADRRVATGYTNSPLSLLPGAYRLEFGMHPPLSRRIKLSPAARLVLGLPKVGMLRVKRAGGGVVREYRVLNAAGRPVAEGRGERKFFLGPGTYVVSFSHGREVRVQIEAGRLAVVSPPGPRID